MPAKAYVGFNMNDKINFKLFKPFGSTVAKAVMPLELIKDFSNDLKEIRKDKEKQKNHDWSKKLVGHVDSEYLISPEIMLKWKQKFFDPIINTYVKNHINHKIKSISTELLESSVPRNPDAQPHRSQA